MRHIDLPPLPLDDLPLATFMEQRLSVEELYSDEQVNSEEDSEAEESTDEEVKPDDEEQEQENWGLFLESPETFRAYFG